MRKPGLDDTLHLRRGPTLAARPPAAAKRFYDEERISFRIAIELLDFGGVEIRPADVIGECRRLLGGQAAELDVHASTQRPGASDQPGNGMRRPDVFRSHRRRD